MKRLEVFGLSIFYFSLLSNEDQQFFEFPYYMYIIVFQLYENR